MRAIKRVMSRLGSLVDHGYNANAVLEKASRDLLDQVPALEFVNSQGWTLVQKKYREMINEMKRRIVFLAADARGNEKDIQRTSDLITACELMLDLTNRVIRAHQEALKTINTNLQGIDKGNTAR